MGKAVGDLYSAERLCFPEVAHDDWHSSKSKFAAGACLGRSLAYLDGHHSASIDYRSSRAREGLATFRRTALDIQEIRPV
jgi:hypothetical protein